MSDVSQTDPLAHLPGYVLRRAASAMMSDLAARLGAVDLRITDAAVMLLVAGRDDMTSADIGKALDIQRANMVPLLNRLEAAGLVTRSPIDRKSRAIVLTETGERRTEEVRAITEAFEKDLMDRIPPKHRPHFMPALSALLA